MRRVTDFKTSDAIAFELGISANTVDTHVANLCRNLGVSSRFDAAKLLLAHDTVWRAGIREIPPIDHIIVPVDIDPTEAKDEARLRDVAAERIDTPFARLTTTAPARQEARRNDLTILQRLTLIAILVLAFAVMVIAATPMAESYQALANSIEPFHQN